MANSFLSIRQLPFYLMVLVLLALAGCTAYPKTVTFNHETYRYQASTDAAQVYQSDSGQTLRVEDSDQGTRVNAGGQVYLVSGSANDFQVILPTGVQLSRHYNANSSYGGTAPGAEVNMEDWDRVDELRMIVFQRDISQASHPIWRYPLGLLLMAAGFLQLLNPRLAWQIAEGWRYANLEPSDIYLGLSRVGGVVMILAGLFVLFGAVK